MPTIHVPKGVREVIDKAVVDATKAAKRPVRRSEAVKILINKGFSEMSQAEWAEALKE